MERERITISIKKPVLEQVDKIIDGIAIRNRSHAFETLALQALGKQEKIEAVVMLGGSEALKLIPLAEKFIQKSKNIGISEIIIATGFLADKIKDRLGDGSKYGVKLHYSTEGEGTGGALSVLKNRLKNTFIVFNLSNEINYDLESLIKFHKDRNTVLTITTNNLSSLEGVYVAEPSILKYIKENEFSLLEEDVIPEMVKHGEVVVVPSI